jgi:Na+/melibiose symporter-like transporter
MEIVWGLFLPVLFLVGVVSVGVYLLTWLVAQLFPVTTQRWQRIREEISHSRGKEASSRASHTEETEKERHRKAA